MTKKVFVSGCFDLLHSGHVAFFEEAAKHGDLYVAIGSDRTIYELKGRATVNHEEERRYMIKSMACVKDAFISRGTGMLDFLNEFHLVKPDIFIVNEDGNIPEKKKLCEEHNVQYVILKRDPHPGLAVRSTTALRGVSAIPYRIDICGGWLDQPFVSKYYPGPVLTISIHPTIEFNERSGMASSTRRAAIDLWGPRLPAGSPEKLAKMLFCYDNPPGTEEISGSQDSIGIIFPGLNKADYAGKYWPTHIQSIHDETIIQMIEKSLFLIPLGPRHNDYHVLHNTRIDYAGAKALADAAETCWTALQNKDFKHSGPACGLALKRKSRCFPTCSPTT